MQSHGSTTATSEQNDTGLKAEPLTERLAKHARINWNNLAIPEVPSPPFLILFINSLCNMKCEHCFYWQQLNQQDGSDVRGDRRAFGGPRAHREPEPVRRRALSAKGIRRRSAGSSSGATASRRSTFPPTGTSPSRRSRHSARCCRNRASGSSASSSRSTGCPSSTTSSARRRTRSGRPWRRTTRWPSSRRRTRVCRSIRSRRPPRQNMAEIKQLTTFLYDRCPQMMHHNLAIIRGDRKNPTLQGPALQDYREPVQLRPKPVGGARREPLRVDRRAHAAVRQTERRPKSSASSCRAAPAC